MISIDAKTRMANLEREYRDNIKKVLFEEAKKNNPYKVGDIIEDHYQIGKIIAPIIRYDLERKTYNIYYKCVQYTKKLVPYKKSGQIRIYLGNIVRLHTKK